MEIVKASEQEYGAGFFLKAILIGDAGSGKTTAIGSMPGRTLLLDWDGGSEALYGHPTVEIIRYNDHEPHRKWSQWQKDKAEISAQLAKGTFPYDTIGADSLSMLYEMAMGYAMLVDPSRGPGGSEQSNHYKVEKRQGTEVIEWLLHIPCHVIATVHEEHDKDELLNRIFYFPTIRGKDAPRVVRRFREVYHTFAQSAKDTSGKEVAEFWWRTSPELQRPYLKSSLNTNQKYWTALVGPNPSFASLLARRGIKLKLKGVQDG